MEINEKTNWDIVNEKYDLEGIVPKPKLNLQWNKEKGVYSDGDVEDIIINHLIHNREDEFADILATQLSWPIYYHLTQKRKNILNWYPFKEGAETLEIGCGMGAITSALCDKCAHVTAVELSRRRATATWIRCREKENLEVLVGNLNDIEFDKKFDYITLIGVLEYQGVYTDSENPYVDFLEKIKKLLKPNGKLLIAIENKYGLKYWCGVREDHTGIPFDGMNQYNHTEKSAKTFSKQELGEILNESGFDSHYFYYPMPDYKLPTVIYSEDYLPKTSNMENMKPYYSTGADTVVADEMKIYEDVIKNNVFEFFANSFFVECTANQMKLGEVLGAVMSSERMPEYRVATIIKRDNTVDKIQTHGKTDYQHIQQIYNNMEYLKGRIDVVPYEWKEQTHTFITERIQKKTLADKICEAYKQKNKTEIWKLFNALMAQIEQSSDEAGANENVLYKEDIVDPDGNNDYGKVLKIGFLDLIARNCFVQNEKYLWFDQEWTMENVPSKYIFQRNLIELYTSYEWMEGVVGLAEVVNHYGIMNRWKAYQTLNGVFFKRVCDIGTIQGEGIYRGKLDNLIQTNINKLFQQGKSKMPEQEDNKELEKIIDSINFLLNDKRYTELVETFTGCDTLELDTSMRNFLEILEIYKIEEQNGNQTILGKYLNYEQLMNHYQELIKVIRRADDAAEFQEDMLQYISEKEVSAEEIYVAIINEFPNSSEAIGKIAQLICESGDEKMADKLLAFINDL